MLRRIAHRMPADDERRLALGWCAFLVHVWAYYSLADSLPAWLLRLDAWDLLGLISYVLAFALWESLAIWIALLVLAMLLPAAWLRQRFLLRSTLIALVAALWALLFHFRLGELAPRVMQWPLWLGMILLSLCLAGFLGGRLVKLEATLHTALEKVFVLSIIYLGLDVVAMIIVLIRNLF